MSPSQSASNKQAAVAAAQVDRSAWGHMIVGNRHRQTASAVHAVGALAGVRLCRWPAAVATGATMLHAKPSLLLALQRCEQAVHGKWHCLTQQQIWHAAKPTAPALDGVLQKQFVYVCPPKLPAQNTCYMESGVEARMHTFTAAAGVLHVQS